MGQLVEDAVLRRLRSAGGIEVHRGGPADLLLSVMEGPPVHVALDVKHRYTEDALEQLEESRQAHQYPVILVVPELSPRRRKELRLRNVSWIEYRTGVAHVRVPGLAIDLTGETPHAAGADPTALPSLAGKAGVVVEAVLELARESAIVAQPEVAQLSGSTQAWTSRVFTSLVAAGALEVVGAGPRKQWRPDPERLLDLWIRDGGASPASVGLYLWVRSTEQLLGRLVELGGDGMRYAVGGTAAANLHEPTLTAGPDPHVWLAAADPPEWIANALGGELVDSGANITIWQSPGDPALRLAGALAQWKSENAQDLAQLSVVTPARAVVESMTATGRGPEAGEKLRRAIVRKAQSRGDDDAS